MNHVTEEKGQDARVAAQERAGEIMRADARVNGSELTVNKSQQAAVIGAAVALLGIPEDVSREANNTLNLLRSLRNEETDESRRRTLEDQVVRLERSLGAGNDNMPTAFKKTGSSTEIVNDPDLHARAIAERMSKETGFREAARRGEEKVRQAAIASGQAVAHVLTENDLNNASRFVHLEDERKGEIALAYSEGYEKGLADGAAGKTSNDGILGLTEGEKAELREAGSTHAGLPIKAGEEITDVVEDKRDGAADVLGLQS